jgi:hypothetical protein
MVTLGIAGSEVLRCETASRRYTCPKDADATQEAIDRTPDPQSEWGWIYGFVRISPLRTPEERAKYDAARSPYADGQRDAAAGFSSVTTLVRHSLYL